jgi:pimeloyl-ACP methyl ester carboxylesterase
MFASRYGDEVAGLVLADPTAPELFERLPSARADLSNAEQQARVFQVLAPVGLVRLLMPGALEAELSAYPVRARDEIVALNSVGRQWHGLEAEVEGLPASMAEVAQTGHLGARPLVVLSSTESASASADDRAVRYALGAEAVALSSNSRYIVVPGATHSGLTAQPQYAAVTARAIQAVVDAVRSGASLKRGGACGQLMLDPSRRRPARLPQAKFAPDVLRAAWIATSGP